LFLGVAAEEFQYLFAQLIGAEFTAGLFGVVFSVFTHNIFGCLENRCPVLGEVGKRRAIKPEICG
jgi:hypothetical protein